MPLLTALLEAAVRTEDYLMGSACCLAYIFALRVPSELLAQGRRNQLRVFPDRICIIDLKRKGRVQLSELVRSCTCRARPLTCPHLWVDYALNATSAARLFPITSAQFHLRFQVLLRAAGVPPDVCPQYTSHAFRRGVGVDILERQGLPAMLAYGQWQTPRSAASYATWDEMDRQAIGTLTADASDED